MESEINMIIRSILEMIKGEYKELEDLYSQTDALTPEDKGAALEVKMKIKLCNQRIKYLSTSVNELYKYRTAKGE